MNLNLFIYGEVQNYVGLRNKLQLTSIYTNPMFNPYK